VDGPTQAKLIGLNRQFYQTFADQFSASRMRLQPGVRLILDRIPSPAKLLDLGCGNGELARTLARRDHQGLYVGIDFSKDLLDIARRIPAAPLEHFFICADLASSDWPATLDDIQSRSSAIQSKAHTFQSDIVLAFAVLHHLPGPRLHQQVIRQIRSLLPSGGEFIHSVWQFLSSERWRKRIQPWELVNISPGDVEPGDYLLDWRSGGYGLRYVHHFDEVELSDLALGGGFEVVDGFFSDGEGGRLSLYQVWKAV